MGNSTNVKLILFDIGNVLVHYDSKQLCINLNQYSALPDHNYLNIEDYLFNFGVFTRLELGQISIDDLYIDLKTRFNLHCDCYDFVSSWTKELRVHASMRWLVSSLSKKFEIGVLSNIDSLRYRHMANIGMLDTSRLAYSFLSYVMGMVKPDIRIADYVNYQSGFDKSQILFIDDKDVNVRSMQAGGIKSIQYKNYTRLLNALKVIGIEP